MAFLKAVVILLFSKTFFFIYNFHRHFLYTVYFVAALTSQLVMHYEEGWDIR